jgi:hypothetical protein
LNETSRGLAVRSRDGSVQNWGDGPYRDNPLLLFDDPGALPELFVGFTEETTKTCFYGRDVCRLSGYNALSSAAVTNGTGADLKTALS